VSSEPAVLAISSPNRAGQARGLQICSTISGDGTIARSTIFKRASA
jgi:hypothetical protein